MNKLINYLKRYYQCVYKFDLYRDYFKEPKVLALIFIIPMFIAFSWITYQGTVTGPELIKSSFDPYYDIVTSTTYEEVIDFDALDDEQTSALTVLPEDTISVSFVDGVLSLDQTMPLDKTIKKDELIYHLIIDTTNEYNISMTSEEDVTKEISDLLTLGKQDMLLYVNNTSMIMELNGNLMVQSLSDFKMDFESTESIYHYAKENYYDKSYYLILAAFLSFFLISMYYFVNYFVMRSLLKRHGFTLSTGRKFTIIFYTMQPGLYVYFILSLIMGQSSMTTSFIVPLASALAMLFVNTKTIDSVKDYVKKEQKAEKRLKRKQ